MSITAYKVEAVGHDRTGKDFGYVNIMYRYGNKQSCPRPDQCEKMEVMWADESVYGPPAPGSKVGDFSQKVRDIILDFAKDPNEYVSRRALLAMPALRPDCVEQFAPLFWERNCYSPELQE